jgi:hypothetical protein
VNKRAKHIAEAVLLAAVCVAVIHAAANARVNSALPTDAPDKSWIARSNEFAKILNDINNKHTPEAGSADNLSQYDELISIPTHEEDVAETSENRSALATLKDALAKEQNKYVRQDLQIMIHATELGLRRHDFAQDHQVPYLNASAAVFQGLRVLLDDQVSAERRRAALVRLRKYAGLEPAGSTPFTERLKTLTKLQLAKPNTIYPSKLTIDNGLARNQLMVDGIASLFKQYNLQGWEQPFATLKSQLAGYDLWVRAEILPKARTDFRQPPELYALNLEGYGIDVPPADLAATAHKAFAEYQGEMQTIAAQIVKENNWPSMDYRDVIKKLKENQLVGDSILPFYKQRLKEIEVIIAQQKLVTLPDRPARIRIGSPAESAQQPAPHMLPPPLLHNTGQQGEFVLPLNMPVAGSAKSEKVDDYTFDAASWTLIAHEARPGHELQFDSMVERGVSQARSRYAFNSTNVEGWGLYAEYITKPYMPLEGQLISLQFRLLRAARAFLDPELQAGKVQPQEAMKVLTDDGVFSVPFANQEVERYTYRSPGQANSYFYGYTKLLQLRKDTEATLGAKFGAQKFHDFVLSQGLLPPDLMRTAVTEDFIPSQQAGADAKTAR